MFKLLVDLLVGLKTKLIIAGLALIAFAGWIMKIKYQARKEGEERYRKKIDAQTKKVEDAWTKIDRTPSDVDAALSRLQRRSTDSGYGPKS